MGARVSTLLLFLVSCDLRGQTVSPPVILNSSEAANAGDVIYIQGSGFGTSPFVQYSYNDFNWTALTPINSAHGYAAVQIPASETRLPDLLTVRVSADNSNWSAPVYLNRARGISVDTDQIAPGSSFRIFGRNLFFDRTPLVRLVDQADQSSLSARVSMLNSTPFLLTVTAPTGVVAGHSYNIFVSNSYSGNSSTVAETLVAQAVTGRAGGTDYWGLGVSWAPDLTSWTNIYNVQTDSRLPLHAAGNGAGDDTAALVNALATAGKAGGGVVYLPAGWYRLVFGNGCGLTLPPNVVLMGAGQNQTTMYYGYGAAPGLNQGGYAVCFANKTGISDMALFNVNSSGQWPQSGASVGSQDVFLQRVNWNIGTSQWVTLTNAHNLAIKNSTITQALDTTYLLGPLALAGCVRCEVKGNTINFAVTGIVLDGTADVVFENNRVIRDISMTPLPQSVTHSVAANFAKNLTLINNTFSSIGNALPTNNDGEVIATEGGGPIRFDEFRGTVSASSGSTISDAAQNFFQSTNSVAALRAGVASVAIVSGSGMGQVRLVTAVSSDGKTLTVDHPWDVPVEVGANYATFDWSADSWILANNTMTGNFKGIEIFDASASDVLIQSNLMTDSDGIMISPSQQPPGLFNVIRGLTIAGNEVSDIAGLRPSYIGLIPREDSQTTSFGTAILGATVTNNTVVGFTPNVSVNNISWDDFKVVSEGYLNYWFWQSASAYSPTNAPPPILGTIFQNNRARNSKTAFVLNTGASETIIQDYVLLNVATNMSNQPILGSKVGSENTAMQGALTFIPFTPGAFKNVQAIQTHPKSPQR